MVRTSWTYRFFALTMATLVGVSSVSWTVVEHYCQGALHKVSLIVDAGSCHDSVAETCVADMMSCCSSMTSDHDDCCTDEVDLLDHESTIIIPSDEQGDIADHYIVNALDFSDSVLWPLAKTNPVRGPCASDNLISCPDLAQIQSWLI